MAKVALLRKVHLNLPLNKTIALSTLLPVLKIARKNPIDSINNR